MEARPHVLIVDDDDRLRALIGRYLRENGFAVSMAANAAQARALLEVFLFDLMVLDVMMPGEDGLSLAAGLRGRKAPPILMLSARTEVDDRLAGLEAGVDDYLTKPFEPRELVLRIRAIMRRADALSLRSRKVSFGDYLFDLDSLQLLQAGAIVHLTSAEASLLRQLAENTGRPVTREELARQMGIEEGNERSVDVQITRLRKKIEPDGRPQHIQTVRGAGYQLQGRVA